MKTFRHIILALTALILASCAVDEFWDGSDYTEGEEVVMTFRPKFEDFEAVTKAIGDGSKVDKLLVQVYDELGETPVFSKVYSRVDWKKIQIAFYYGKTYKVYFWAYNSVGNAYEIAEGGLKNGVTVTYPDNTQNLAYDALEHLDAFYAVETINLSDTNPDNTTPSLTRPFAQVNLLANKSELLNAKASTVIFELSAASDFVPGGDAIGEPVSRTFTFTSDDYFQSITDSLDGKVYLGTTYIFVSSQEISGKVTLKDEKGKTLRGPSEITIPLAENSRTNLVFSGIQPAKLPWDDNKFVVPGVDDNDGWIHITCPEELAALLIKQTEDNINVHICEDIDMGDVDGSILDQITGKAFNGLTLDGGIYPDNDMTATPTGNNTIKNLSAAAFIGTATNLTVRNLTVDNLHITNDDGHVGTLVNTLRGTSSFSNINVYNSSATTSNGAAGGIVGYIERKLPKERSEELEVAFSGCSVNGSQDKPVANANDTNAEGKFVGLFSGYDNGEKLVFTNCTSEKAIVADYNSRYVEGNEGAWLAGNNYSAYNGFLGAETYFRGKVYFGGEDEATNRFCAKWDGVTTVEPLLANPTYDGANAVAGTNKFAVYSPFDLAGVRKKTASPAAIYLKADIDLNGQGVDGSYNVPSNFKKSAHSSADDIVFDPFSYVTTLDGYRDASTNNSIYNMSIAQIEQERAAFILYASGTTVHKNINFRNCQTVAVHKPVTTDAKAYGAILVSNVEATYTMENVHAYGCKVFALQKIGTLGARISGTSTLKNNSVNNCYVENYECNISERFTSGKKTISRWTVEVYADFYPHGEVGGMYGFIQGSSTLTNCKVNATTLYAFGQDDKMATVDGSLLAKLGIAGLGYYKVPGRHVSTMIGNIRATGTVTLTGCSVDANTKCTNRHDKHNNTYNYIGQAYIVKFVDSEGSVTVDGKKLTLADCNKNTQR